MWQPSKLKIIIAKMMIKVRFLIYVCWAVSLGLFALNSQAQDEPLEDAGQSLPAIYLPIKPAFVVNYGGEGRLRYLKTEIAVRLKNNETASAVRHHLPFIRNNLVMLFAAQTDEDLQSQEGREMLRGKVLEQVKLVLDQEDGNSDGVIDVFFSTFIVQK